MFKTLQWPTTTAMSFLYLVVHFIACKICWIVHSAWKHRFQYSRKPWIMYCFFNTKLSTVQVGVIFCIFLWQIWKL